MNFYGPTITLITTKSKSPLEPGWCQGQPPALASPLGWGLCAVAMLAAILTRTNAWYHQFCLFLDVDWVWGVGHCRWHSIGLNNYHNQFWHFIRRALATALCSRDPVTVSPQNCPKIDRMFNDFASGGDCGTLSNFDGVAPRWCTQANHLEAGDVGWSAFKCWS